MHHGKTQVWNRGVDILTSAARRLKPEAVVCGDASLPRWQQGV